MQALDRRLRDVRDTLPPAEGRVAAYFLQNPASLQETTIATVAQACGVAKSAVVRLCKRLGMKGYKEFLQALRAERLIGAAARREQVILGMDESLPSACEEVMRHGIGVLSAALSRLDMGAMHAATCVIAGARRIALYGSMESAGIAAWLSVALLRLGLPAEAVQGVDAQSLHAAGLREGDAAVILMQDGQEEALEGSRALAEQCGAAVVIIGSRSGSDLDIHLPAPGGAYSFPDISLPSQMAMTGMAEMLLVSVARAHGQARRPTADGDSAR